MTARETYHRLPRAAYRFDTAGALSAAKAKVLVAAEGGLEALILSTLHPDGTP
jgi:hypothetical protein